MKTINKFIPILQFMSSSIGQLLFNFLGTVIANVIVIDNLFLLHLSESMLSALGLIVLLLFVAFQGDSVTHCTQQSLHINMLFGKLL